MAHLGCLRHARHVTSLLGHLLKSTKKNPQNKHSKLKYHLITLSRDTHVYRMLYE